MSYSKTLDAFIPTVTTPSDISEQKFHILADYGIRMDMVVTCIYNTLFTLFREGRAKTQVTDSEILWQVRQENPWLAPFVNKAQMDIIAAGTDLRKIENKVIHGILDELITTLFRKYYHNAWECLYQFLRICQAELGRTDLPIRIDLTGIAVNTELQTYELRAQAYLI